MELNYVVDITSAYNDVLMTYGDNYQVQRYTHGIDRISMDFWMLEDHDNGWIPNGSEMNLSGERQRLYYLHDELGSVTKVIGENGKTSAHYNYDEFGRPLPSVKFDQNWPGPDNTFGYAGYQYDASAGLWYAQARYYMPEIGRFISEDPYPSRVLIPNSFNPYTYVLNNPLKYVDPLGLMFEEGPGSSRAVYNAGAAEKAHKEVLNKQASKSSSLTTKVSNQVQKQETKNGSDAIYGNLEERTLLDRVKQAGSGALDVIGGLGQVGLGAGIAAGGTAASGGLLGGVAVAGGGSIVVVGTSNIAGGGAKILDAITTQDLNESKVDFVEYAASKNSYTKLAYNAIDIGSGLTSTGAGVKSIIDHAKNGGRVVDMTYDTLQAKKVLRETINASDDLSILGQRGKSAYVVLDKSVDSKTALDYTGTVIGAGQAIDWLADKLFH